ncbi:MAG: hypothetical protein PHU72_03080, partial [Dethiosulfovibrio sp.]|nr:hypothetical protein [Dethiosulfovibrio sp.]
MKKIVIDGNSLSLEEFIAVTRFEAKVDISDDGFEKIAAS